jgi:hypothetical protein
VRLHTSDRMQNNDGRERPIARWFVKGCSDVDVVH